MPDTHTTPDPVDPVEHRNGRRFVVSQGLQGVGDQLVNPKTVLPWLLHSMGAGSLLIALLVPVREAGSMLPQAALAPWLEAKRHRAGVWVLGSVVQGLAAAAIGVLALVADGPAGGLAVVLALAVLAVARSLSSLSSKDVMGRTIEKGRRGRITGWSTTVGGAAALTVGVAIRLMGSDVPDWLLAALMLGAGAMWGLAAAVFARTEEPEAPVEPAEERSWWRDAVSLLRAEPGLARFVLVRSLLLVSALSPSFLVAIAASRGAGAITGLGSFIIASGVAALVGGRLFGGLADRSSRLTMTTGAAVASALLIVAIVLALTSSDAVLAWALPIIFTLLALVHTQVRVARKTYVVDMAGDEHRTEYVAVTNTALGVVLLVTGAVSRELALPGDLVAIGFLAALGLVGAVMARRLPEVSVGE